MILLIASLLLGLAWIVLWRSTTSAERAVEVTDHGIGHFLEIGIYKDHPRVMFRCLGDLFLVSFRLARLLLPVSILFVLPCLLVVPYVASTFQSRPLEVGETTVLSVKSSEPIRLELPPGLVTEAGPVHDRSSQSYYWRLRGETPGVHLVRLGHTDLTKTVRVGDSGTVNGRRTPAWGHWLFHPTEWPLPAGPVVEIRVDYPKRTLWVGDHEVHWGWFLFLGFLLSTVALSKIPRRG
jgi:hypothetical protein